MYAYIKGTVDETGADRAVVEAAGIGFELFCSTMTLKTLAGWVMKYVSARQGHSAKQNAGSLSR